jgi:hypothetical protein
LVFAPEKAGAQAEWRPVAGGKSGLVELDKLMRGENRVAYLRTRVTSGKEQEATLELGSDDGIFAKDLIEVAETKKQDRPRGELLTKLAVLPLHRGFFFHCVEGNSPQTRAQERTTLPHPRGVGSCSHQLGGELG